MKITLIKLLAHLANSFGWTEDYMMNMSLSRLLLYYMASLDLPYIIPLQEADAEVKENKVEKVKKEKKGLWEITTTTINN